LADVVVTFLHDFQQKYYSFDDEFVAKKLSEGNGKAKVIAAETMAKVKRAVGVL